jgi:3-oxoacyl-[acyl-carrier protein] reductase
MEISFEGKTVLVTGAVRGIGRTIAQAFAERGARVFASDILTDELEEAIAAKPITGSGSITALPLDVTDGDAVNAAAQGIVSDAGALDVLVHAAGGVRGQSPKPIEEVSDADWQAIFQANVTGAFNLVRAATPSMKQAGKGRVVIISSRAGLGVSLTGIQSYAMSKAGQIGLVRQLAHELGPFGITVNSVAPGFMRTSPDYEKQWQSFDKAKQKAVMNRVAMRRPGQPEDIAHAVMFFASDYAGWVTGQTLPVTGSP